MDKRIFEQIKDFLGKNQKIEIAVGKNPGIDEMAGALAFYLSLLKEGKNVTIACPTQPLVEHSSLVGIDKVKANFEGGAGDMVVSFPYREGEIEKISYTLEEGFLNIVVKPAEEGLSFSEKDVIFKRSGGYSALLFVIGTPRLSDLDKIFDPHALKDTTVVNIDNKHDNQGFGDIVLVSPGHSSISEKISDLMLSLDLPMDIDIAQNLMLGIESATDNFQDPKTSPTAFEQAAILMKKGAMRTGPSLKRSPAFLDEVSPIFSPKSSRIIPSADISDKKNKDKQEKNPPTDWLAPKIYKGSTNI